MLEVHRAATQRREVAEDEAREEAFFKRFLEFCRARVAPRLSEAAANSLVSQYVELREQVGSFPILSVVHFFSGCVPSLEGMPSILKAQQHLAEDAANSLISQYVELREQVSCLSEFPWLIAPLLLGCSQEY